MSPISRDAFREPPDRDTKRRERIARDFRRNEQLEAMSSCPSATQTASRRSTAPPPASLWACMPSSARRYVRANFAARWREPFETGIGTSGVSPKSLAGGVG